MPSALRVAAAIDRCNQRIARATAWLLLVMVLVGAFNALARTLEKEAGLAVKLTSNALVELQWYLFGLTFLLGAPFALRNGDHVRVDVIYGGLSLRARLWIDVCGCILFLIPSCLAAIWLSIDFVADSIAENEWSNDPGGLPRWPIKPVIPIAFALLSAQAVSEVLKRVAVLRGRATAAEAGLVAAGSEDVS